MVNYEHVVINHDNIVVNHDNIVVNHDNIVVNQDTIVVNHDKFLCQMANCLKIKKTLNRFYGNSLELAIASC